MSSYLTREEIDSLKASILPSETPFMIRNVSASMFSLARHSGGAKLNGASYTYLPDTDELIRDDVLKFIAKARKQAAKAAADLFEVTE